MRPNAARVRAKLAAMEMTQADLARELETSPAMISQLLAGKRRSRRLELMIAGLTGLSHRSIWPRNSSRSRRTT